MRTMSMDWKAVTQSFLNSQNMSRLPAMVAMLLVVALTYNVAQITWKLLPISTLNEVIPANKSNISGSGVEKIKQVSLSQLHLFGEAKVQKQTKRVSQAIKAPITRLNLTLKGVIASGRSNIAKAIIADSSGHENFYAIGAKIPGGAILEEIHVSHVILKRNNRLETLQLPKDIPKSQSFKGSRTARSRNRNKIAFNSSANKDARTLLREYKQTLKTDPQKLMDLVRTQPYREKGKLVGYKIRPGKDRRLLRKFGLRSGDVVTAVNGISLNNPINGLEILKNLTTASQVSVDIKRNGIAQSLSFQVD